MTSKEIYFLDSLRKCRNILANIENQLKKDRALRNSTETSKDESDKSIGRPNNGILKEYNGEPSHSIRIC